MVDPIREATEEVAPRAGAWIERSTTSISASGQRSLPERERGLKVKGKCPVVDVESRSPSGSVD